MSDTPRTDAIQLTELGAVGCLVDYHALCCQLERENAALIHDIERAAATNAELATELENATVSGQKAAAAWAATQMELEAERRAREESK